MGVGAEGTEVGLGKSLPVRACNDCNDNPNSGTGLGDILDAGNGGLANANIPDACHVGTFARENGLSEAGPDHVSANEIEDVLKVVKDVKDGATPIVEPI